MNLQIGQQVEHRIKNERSRRTGGVRKSDNPKIEWYRCEVIQTTFTQVQVKFKNGITKWVMPDSLREIQ